MRWQVWRITLALYPFDAGAMAVNVFFASLLGKWAGLQVLSSAQSLAIGAVIAIPLTWLFARHIRCLMDQADGSKDR